MFYRRAKQRPLPWNDWPIPANTPVRIKSVLTKRVSGFASAIGTSNADIKRTFSTTNNYYMLIIYLYIVPGKGKGLAGRRNVVDNSGYVTGYQHKNTYDKTH